MDIEKIIDKINKDAFEYQQKHGFDTFFDFLSEDLDEINERNTELFKALQIIDECLALGVPVENGDLIHKQIQKLIR